MEAATELLCARLCVELDLDPKPQVTLLYRQGS